MQKEVYSICFGCSVRCPIRVIVEDDRVKWLEGNPHVPGIDGSLCPRGMSQIAVLYDHERLQSPMTRTGPRGSGKWKKVSWDEALNFVGEKLKAIITEYGGKSVVLGERTQLSTHVSKTFLRAIGSPNHFTHDAICKGSVNTAGRSLFGYTDAQMNFDYANTKHIVMYGRNLFEAIEVKSTNNMMKALDNGAKLTYIDP